jgi:hypothetical protein
MILMRLTHIEKRLERLMTFRPKRHRTAIPRPRDVGSNNKKHRKRKTNRS